MLVGSVVGKSFLEEGEQPREVRIVAGPAERTC